jgi:sodium pump decarboxylase gamma subunit
MENLGWGLQMTVLGMGLVFGLLALLWGLLTLAAKFDRPAAPAPAAAPAPEPLAGPLQVNGMDAALVAAITAAVLQHKAMQRREAAPAMRTYWPGSLLYASRWVASGRVRQTRGWMRGK